MRAEEGCGQPGPDVARKTTPGPHSAVDGATIAGQTTRGKRWHGGLARPKQQPGNAVAAHRGLWPIDKSSWPGRRARGEQYLKGPHLPTFRSSFEELARQAQQESHSYERYLLELAQRETQERQSKRIERLLRYSQLPQDKSWSALDLKRFAVTPRRGTTIGASSHQVARDFTQTGCEMERGPSRIRTGDGGFAIRCLTAWRRGQGRSPC
jgi:hypothetical protein